MHYAQPGVAAAPGALGVSEERRSQSAEARGETDEKQVWVALESFVAGVGLGARFRSDPAPAAQPVGGSVAA